MKTAKKVLTYVVIVGIAAVCALNYAVFIFPNRFAPSGLNGICTMIQYVSGINIGYLSLLINVPFAIAVYVLVSKPLAIRSMVYVVTFSVISVLLEYVDLSAFVYYTETGTSTILGPLVAGVIFGSCYAMLLRASAYSGGTDFVASLIISSGTPCAPGISPPNSLHLSTNSRSTVDAPWSTSGVSGISPWISLSLSKSR